jgi:hypothetical protein
MAVGAIADVEKLLAFTLGDLVNPEARVTRQETDRGATPTRLNKKIFRAGKRRGETRRAHPTMMACLFGHSGA